MVGPPLVYPSYGDLQNSWAQGSHSTNEFIELEFPKELIVKKLNIYGKFSSYELIYSLNMQFVMHIRNFSCWCYSSY